MGTYQAVKDAFWEKIERDNDQFTLKIRAKYQTRWMKLSNTDDPTKIDLTNPIINLEFFLSDFRIIARLTGGKRDEVLAMMDETQRQVYLTCKDEYGNPYTDIEKQSLYAQLGKATRDAYKQRRAKKKEKRMGDTD